MVNKEYLFCMIIAICYVFCYLQIALQDCVTVGGGSGNKDKRCIFPFRYNGKKYNHCISKAGNEKPWCSTKVTKGHHHVGNGGNWGYCSPSCPFSPNRGKLS